MSKNIEDLRETLFAVLQGVKDGTLDIERARAVNDIARTLCDTARVEVAYINATGSGETTFLAAGADKRLPAPTQDAAANNGIVGITRHVLRG